MKHDWLHDNVVPTIALSYMALSFTVKFIIVLGLSSASETLTSTIESNDNNLMIFVFGFYFGSSVTTNKAKPATNIQNIEQVDMSKPPNG